MGFNLKQKGVLDAIAEYLDKNLDKKEGVLELNCGNGELAEFLADRGFKNYHGITGGDAEKAKALKTKIKAYKSRFHAEDNGRHKRDVIVCLNGTPFQDIEKGQRLIVLTSGFDDYDDVLLRINHLYEDGAKTVQHEDLFLTFGTRA